LHTLLLLLLLPPPLLLLLLCIQMTHLHVHHPVRHELCDPTKAIFGQRLLLLDTDNTTVLPLSDDLWTTRQQQLSRRLLEATSSPICEVLGLQQRRWLQETMQNSKAALNIIASGSVLAGSVGWREGQYSNQCSGDDLECWGRAQVNLLHTIANASGCSVVITGDFHYSDLKVIQPGINRS
jgi:alkaline phosphatase D